MRHCVHRLRRHREFTLFDPVFTSILANIARFLVEWTNKLTSKWNQAQFTHPRKHHASKLKYWPETGSLVPFHHSRYQPHQHACALAYYTYLPRSQQPASTFGFSTFSFSMELIGEFQYESTFSFRFSMTAHICHHINRIAIKPHCWIVFWRKWLDHDTSNIWIHIQSTLYPSMCETLPLS